MPFGKNFSQDGSPSPARRDARTRLRASLAILMTLLAVLILLGGALTLPAAVIAQETTTPEGSQNESWDSDDPACQGLQRPGTTQAADELSDRCMKTPEEKQQDAQDRQAAEEGGGDTNGEDESGMNGVPEGYQRNAGPAGAATPTEEQSDSADENYDTTQDTMTEPGGFTGLAVSAFEAILEKLYDKAVTEPTEDITAFLTDEAFDLPETDQGGLKEKYDAFADLVKPGAIPVMLVLGYLMMFQGANYNAAVAAQSSLPKIFLFVVGLGFFPELADMLRDISSGLAQVLVSKEGIESFISGSLKEGGEGGMNGALMVANRIIMVVILVLVVLATAIKNLAFSVLWVFGPLPMLLWAIPQTASIAASWARCMAACFALPVIYAAIIGVGTLLAETPSLAFGTDDPGNTTAIIIGIGTMYAVYQAPKQLMSWALGGYSGGSGVMKSIILKRL